MKIAYWQCVEFLSFAFSLVYYRGLKAYSLQLMPFFLFYVCCSESLAAYYVEWGMPTARGFVNIYYVVSAAVFYLLFHNMLRPKGVYDKLYKSIAVLS